MSVSVRAGAHPPGHAPSVALARGRYDPAGCDEGCVQATPADLPSLAEKQPGIGDEPKLVFGKQFTDRMFVMEYDAGQGWHSARIAPYAPFSLDPAALVLHYSQEIFDGLKPFRHEDGRVALFRPLDNIRRFNRSAHRMFMPAVDEAFFHAALQTLISLESACVPPSAGTSM